MFDVNTFLKMTRAWSEFVPDLVCVRPRVLCNDGFSVSIQANEYVYCSPRLDVADHYDTVELGFPSEKDDLILPYAVEEDRPTETVYGWVPVEVVNELINKHGFKGVIEKR